MHLNSIIYNKKKKNVWIFFLPFFAKRERGKGYGLRLISKLGKKSSALTYMTLSKCALFVYFNFLSKLLIFFQQKGFIFYQGYPF